jgi:hypothetical protein
MQKKFKIWTEILSGRKCENKFEWAWKLSKYFEYYLILKMWPNHLKIC